MDDKHDERTSVFNSRLQNILQSLSKCKIEYSNESEECKKIRELNLKLEVELKEARETEKSHRYHLLMSREMIGNLQETVSQLVYLKRDVKKLKEEILLREKTLSAIEKDKEIIIEKNKDSMTELRNAHEKEIEELTVVNDRKFEQVQHAADTQIAQFTCVIEELRSKIKEMEVEHRGKINVVVLEYEEKVQRGSAQITQLQEQLARQTARTEANIDAYRKRLEELEEKLKQSQFKQFLAHSAYPSQYESQVERPYSFARDSYSDTCSVDLDPVLETKPKHQTIPSQNKAAKGSTLQVMYYGKTPNVPKNTEKKGPFNITKKRKLYNDKDFQDI